MDNLSSTVKAEEAEEDTEVIDTGAADNTVEVEERNTDTQEQPIMDRFAALCAQNNDLTGWISIPDTVIDYPVMQCADNGFYLHHDFDKREDRHVCLSFQVQMVIRKQDLSIISFISFIRQIQRKSLHTFMIT